MAEFVLDQVVAQSRIQQYQGKFAQFRTFKRLSQVHLYTRTTPSSSKVDNKGTRKKSIAKIFAFIHIGMEKVVGDHFSALASFWMFLL